MSKTKSLTPAAIRQRRDRLLKHLTELADDLWVIAKQNGNRQAGGEVLRCVERVGEDLLDHSENALDDR